MSYPVDKLKLTEYAAELMVYFEKHKLMEIVTRLMAEISLERPADAQLWIAKNIRRIADEIYKTCLKASYDRRDDNKIFQLPRRFHYRVVIFGRRGSGRKTQAFALVKRFNLIYIDAEQLIYTNLYGTDDLAIELQNAFHNDVATEKSQAIGKIIARRLLQADALRQGWVLVNYPSNLLEFKEVLEKFKVPPNKLVYLKCPEIMAMRRLVEKPNLGRPQDNCKYMEQEMIYFNENEAEINEYLKRRHETIYVDATPCYEAVKTNVWACLKNVPYVMGFKN